MSISGGAGTLRTCDVEYKKFRVSMRVDPNYGFTANPTQSGPPVVLGSLAASFFEGMGFCRLV